MAYESTTYPGGKNNNPNARSDLPIRDLALINQPAGFIEFNNTEGHETFSIVHRSGAMFQMNNFFSGMFSPNGFKSHVIGDSFQQFNGKVTMQADKGMDMIQMGDSFEKSGDIANWQQHSEKFLNAIKPIHNNKRLFELQRVAYRNPIDQSPDQKKSGTLAACPSEEYKTTILYMAKATLVVPAQKTGCERTILTLEPPESYLDDRTKTPEGEPIELEKGRFLNGWWCLTCWGTGDSPSSQDGKWEKEKIKDQIEKQYSDLTNSLVDIEKNFGQPGQPDGGHKITKTGQSRIDVIGTAFNSMESFRTDPLGKLVPYGVKIDPFGSGVYMQYRESPLVEAVHVDPGIGGDKVQTISDRWAVNVGSNGIHFKTSGQFNLFGSIMNITGEAITIHSRNEITLGAERVDIEGEIITLRPKSVTRNIEDSSGNKSNLAANGRDKTEAERQVLIDGNLNVAQNTIIKGGMHVEGELTLHHITAPVEYQVTDSDFEIVGEIDPCATPETRATMGDMIGGKLIGMCDGQKVISVCCEDAISVHPHYHYFKNIPLRLFRDSTVFEISIGDATEEKELLPHDAVRAIGARNNFDKIVLSKPVENSNSPETVISKFGGSCDENLVITDCEWQENSLDNPTFPNGEGIASSKMRETVDKSTTSKSDAKLIEHYNENKIMCDNTFQRTDDFRTIPKGLA